VQDEVNQDGLKQAADSTDFLALLVINTTHYDIVTVMFICCYI